MQHKPSFIESIAEKLGIINYLHSFVPEELPRITNANEIDQLPIARKVASFKFNKALT